MKVPAPYVSQVSQNRLDTPEATAVRSGLTNVGQAMSQVGDVLVREGEIEQKKQTHNRSSDAVARAASEMRTLVQQTQANYRGTKAPEGSKIVEDGLGKITAKYRQELGDNPDALEYFNRNIFSVEDDWKYKNTQFTLNEGDRVYTDSVTGRLADARVRGIQAAGDPKSQQIVIAEASNIIAEFDARMGNPPEATAEKQKNAISSIVAGSVDWLSNVEGRAGYEAAKIYYNNNKDLLIPEQIKHFDASLKARGYALDAIDGSNAFIAENAKKHGGVSEENWKTQQADIKAFVEKHADNPEYQQVLEATLNKNLRRAIGVEAQAFANEVEVIRTSIDQVGYIDDKIASLMTGPKWTSEMKQAMYRYQSSADRATDNDTFQTIFNNIISAEDMSTLSVYESDVAKSVGKLSNANRKFLIDEINDMRSRFADEVKFNNSKEGRLSSDFEMIRRNYINSAFLGVDEKTVNEMTPFYKEKFREMYDALTDNGSRHIKEEQMREIGRMITTDRVIQAAKPVWWGEAAVDVKESDLFKFRFSGKGMEGIAPSRAFIGYGTMDVTSDNFNKLTSVVMQAMDSKDDTEKMRAEMALNMLPIGKTYRQFKAEYEIKHNNGRPLSDAIVAAQYIGQHKIMQPKQSAQRKGVTNLGAAMGIVPMSIK